MKWVAKSPGKLSRFLEEKLHSHSGKSIRRILEANLCKVNGKLERFASRRLVLGDQIELSPAFKSVKALPKYPDLKTLFETEDFKIVEKPAGFICSPEKVRYAFGPNHFLAHRLDVGTTGLLVIAKKKEARDELMTLFKTREVKKSYLAIVDGCMQRKEGVIETLIVKKGSYHGQVIWGSSPYKGTCAITHFKCLKVGKEASLVLCKPVTGRTHQIRVHMAEIGHPIILDPQYARKYRSNIISSRPLLHAYQLQFTYQEEEIDLKAPLPSDFEEVMAIALLDQTSQYV